MKQISIIIPVWNAEKYLKLCLDSILNQTFQDWVCICIDDGSTDSSPQTLDEYAVRDSRFIVQHKENDGVTSARKLGVSLVDTPFLCFADADDRLPSDALERLLYHKKNTGAEIVRGNFSFDRNGIFQENRIPESSLVSRKSENGEYAYSVIAGKTFFPLCLRVCSLWATLFDSEIFKKSDHFPDNKVILGEDGLTLYSILLQTDKMVYVNDIVYLYRDNESGCSHTLYSDPEKELKADIDFTEDLVKLINRYPTKKCSWLKYFVVDNIYGKFQTTQYFQENKVVLKRLYQNWYCKDLSVQLIVWKINWKKWVKMWLAYWKII